MLTYQAWRGIPELGLALKAMLESTFMKVCVHVRCKGCVQLQERSRVG